jgi:electron transfer flavoprotein alpha subunit
MTRMLVYLEHDESGITDLSLQALALARGLGGEPAALLLGEELAGLAAQALERGAASAIIVEHPALRAHLALPAARALAETARETKAELVLLPASTVGNDLAPRAAALLEAACVVDCDGVELTGGAPRLLRTEFDASVRTAYEPVVAGPVFVTLKDGVAQALPAGAAGGGEVVTQAVTLGEADLCGQVERREVAKKTVNLKDARVIVGGGAGVGGKEAFALLERLAARLGGEIGATRASVDAGWVSAERQIGQTGVTVRPDLYIACGISGAVQHLVGIRDAKTVVAINSDASAPIFRVSHYRIVGDLGVVVPKLIELLG